ncbi:hypothetical protein ACTU9R_31500 [Burkholderia gladioli]|uniref:hypothetical protein n=1 Tax=Burkholderia gladioli TaxID=28095 RepID=UPI001640818A|nr:hypothetical protein [Burkholderia gladioli]
MSDHLHTPAKLFDFLNARIDLKTLSDDELSDLAGATEAAVDEAQSLSHLIDSIGCLVSGDLEKEGTGMTRVGSLQEHDVPGLMWYLARQVATIGKITFIASEAAYTLNQRYASGSIAREGVTRG